jgi:hypothetical protein
MYSVQCRCRCEACGPRQEQHVSMRWANGSDAHKDGAKERLAMAYDHIHVDLSLGAASLSIETAAAGICDQRLEAAGRHQERCAARHAVMIAGPPGGHATRAEGKRHHVSTAYLLDPRLKRASSVQKHREKAGRQPRWLHPRKPQNGFPTAEQTPHRERGRGRDGSTSRAG